MRNKNETVHWLWACKKYNVSVIFKTVLHKEEMPSETLVWALPKSAFPCDMEENKILSLELKV